MAYDLAKISMAALMRPAFDAGVAFTYRFQLKPLDKNRVPNYS
jgi:hypothetical protein